MARKVASTVAALACLGMAVAGCAGAPDDDRPVVRIVEAAQPSPAVPMAGFLPTASDMSAALNSAPNSLLGNPVEGGADILLDSMADAQAAPAECISAAYRMQRLAYAAGPVRSVASNTWVGGSFDGPPVSASFGLVQMASPGAAHEFFAEVAGDWQRCNGQTVTRTASASGSGADDVSRVTDVTIDERAVSATVLHASAGTASPPAQRVLGLAGDCIVDVEVIDPRPAGDPRGAVSVAGVILDKITAKR